ncbi:MAG: ABC transporter substrate-binding protein [Myxococcales bacterium]|nr:ABC transporter substrate-binding protein [Myxococcales bacterium]
MRPASGTKGAQVLPCSAALLAAVALFACSSRESLPPGDAARGKALFTRGLTRDGSPVRATLGDGVSELAGEAAACASCHGPSGAGTFEGGILAPDISGARLRREVGPRWPGDPLARPAYGEASLVRAVAGGVGPTGRIFGPAMPRYALGAKDLAHLLAYLRILGTETDPGVSAGALRLGARLPLSGPWAGVGEDVRAVLSAQFEAVNRRGGIYGRRLELALEDATARAPPAAPLSARALAEVASIWRGPPGDDDQLPAVGVIDLQPRERPAVNAFLLQPGAELEARIAVQHALARLTPAAPLVVVGEQGGWARGARAEADRRGVGRGPVRALLEVADARAAAAYRPGAILFQGEAAALGELLEALGEGTPAQVLAPCSVAARLPPAQRAPASKTVLFVCPALLGDQSGRGLAPFSAFLERSGLAPRNLAFQANAYAAATVVMEALKRAGEGVSRAGLVRALESLRDFETGASPPVSFGPERRVGVAGAYLARLETDGRLTPVTGWLELSP